MNLKELVIKPLEVVAGAEFPHSQQIRREVTEDGASANEVEMMLTFRRREFRTDLVHLSGLRRAIEGRF